MVHNISYDEDLIREVVNEAFPECVITRIEQIKKGIMNFVAAVNTTDKQLIVKLSDQPKKYSIHKEAHLYELAREHGIPVPELHYTDFSKKRWPYEVFVAQRLQGVAVQDTWDELSAETKRYVAEQAGTLFAKIHEIRFDKPGRISGDQYTFYEDFYEYNSSFFAKDIATAREMGFIPEEIIEEIEHVYADNKNFLRSFNTFCLSHLDFHFGHLFIDDDYEITGVLDWGFADISVPEFDFFKPHRWIFDKGEQYREAFMQGYQLLRDVPDDLEERIRFFRLNLDLKFIERLVKTDQKQLAREYVQKLREHLTIVRNHDF